MAKYNITNLNYLATGNNRSFLNMDIELGYEIYDFVHLLCAETQSSGFVNLGDAINYRKNGNDDNLCALHHDIGIEHGNGFWYPNKYIQHGESDLDPLSKENYYESIILNEQQDHYVETDPEQRKYIRLYLSCCTNELKQKIQQFNRDREMVNCTYLLDHAENDKNLFKTISHDTNSHVKDMYDIRDVTIKKQGTHGQKNSELFNTDYHHDIYAPQQTQHPIGFCQTNLDSEYLNDTIMMTQNIGMSNYDLKTDLMSTRGDYSSDTFFKSKITDNVGYTYTYCEKNDRQNFGQAIEPKRNYIGISKSYLVDMPVDSAQVPGQHEANDIADYDEGLIYYLRMHTTKSAFNPQYTMEMSSTTSIMNARTYCGIGVCGGRPYLKYYDNSTYNSISAMDGELQHVITQRCNSKSGSAVDNTTTPFQKIEYLYPTDYVNEAKHKSNVFTVNILSTNIGTIATDLNEKIQDNTATPDEYDLMSKLNTLSLDISHAIRDIVEHITPANTQLFDVYFKED